MAMHEDNDNTTAGGWFKSSWKYQSMGMIITYIMEKENVPNHQPGDDPWIIVQ